MGKIFKNILMYKKMIVIILLLLLVQAYCDLALPQYTSNIIDTGIQNKGIEHILPEKILSDEYGYATMYMTEAEKALWDNSYKQEDGYYVLTVTDEKELDELDEKLIIPIVLTYKMANISEEEFLSMLMQGASNIPGMSQGSDGSQMLGTMSVKDLIAMMGIEVKTFTVPDDEGNEVTYIDARPFFMQMIASGLMPQDVLAQSRTGMEAMIETIGSSTLSSMGIAYAAACDAAAGLDVDDIQISFLWKSGFRMLGMALLMLAASILTGFCSAKVGAGIGKNLRSRIFSKVMGFSNAEMDKFSTASLITRCTNDIQQVQMVSVVMLRMLLYAPIIGIGGVVKVAQTGANMGWVIFLAVVVILSFVFLLMAIALPKFKIMQKLIDRVNLVSREILTGLSVIRAFGREKTEEKRFDEANRNLTKTQLFTHRVMTFMMPGMMMIMYGVTVLIVWVASHRIDAGTLQVGAMTAFITYSMQIITSFLMIAMMSIMLPRAGVAAERIDEVMKTESSIKEAQSPKLLENPKGLITFSHVNFRYPGAAEDVLEDIDFTAEPGKTTAIIGSTGCGKTTLINLLPRFYDVTAGSVMIDGIDIRELSLKELREKIGFVPQKGILFSGTIDSNIRFGNKDAEASVIEEAARIAQAEEFIEEKPEKYESSIAQGGTNVSGGQKQRLAIARAIAKNPMIYVFDDSFSALDMKTDVKLRKALESKVKDSTVIIVAQRISTILHADQILVLDDGKIVGKGKHEQLLKDCDVYLQIAKSQLSAKELGIEDSEESDKEVRG